MNIRLHQRWLTMVILIMGAAIVPLASATPATAATPADLCAQVSYDAGFRESSLVTAVAVALAESRCDPAATRSNDPPAHCTLSTDRGLYQINSCWHPEVTNQCAYDPSCNAAAAYRISSGGTSWTQWTTYTGGAYRNFLTEAQAAVDRLTPTVPFGGLAVYSVGAGDAHVFARGSNGHLVQWFYNNTGWHLIDLGGSLAAGSSPTVYSDGPGDAHVFYRATNNRLYTAFYNNTGWHHADMGGSITSNPTTYSNGPGSGHVFARGSNGHLLHWFYNNTGWHLIDLGGNL